MRAVFGAEGLGFHIGFQWRGLERVGMGRNATPAWSVRAGYCLQRPLERKRHSLEPLGDKDDHVPEMAEDPADPE